MRHTFIIAILAVVGLASCATNQPAADLTVTRVQHENIVPRPVKRPEIHTPGRICDTIRINKQAVYELSRVNIRLDVLPNELQLNWECNDPGGNAEIYGLESAIRYAQKEPVSGWLVDFNDKVAGGYMLRITVAKPQPSAMSKDGVLNWRVQTEEVARLEEFPLESIRYLNHPTWGIISIATKKEGVMVAGREQSMMMLHTGQHVKRGYTIIVYAREIEVDADFSAADPLQLLAFLMKPVV